MAISDRQLLDVLSRTLSVDSTELALILGEPHATIHRVLTDLLAKGILGRVSHGNAHPEEARTYVWGAVPRITETPTISRRRFCLPSK